VRQLLLAVTTERFSFRLDWSPYVDCRGSLAALREVREEFFLGQAESMMSGYNPSRSALIQ